MSLVSNVFILFVAGSCSDLLYTATEGSMVWSSGDELHILSCGRFKIYFVSFVFNNSYICEWKTYRESDW